MCYLIRAANVETRHLRNMKRKRTSQERVQLDQQLQVDVVGLGSLSVTRSGVLFRSVISTHFAMTSV